MSFGLAQRLNVEPKGIQISQNKNRIGIYSRNCY